MPVLTTPRLTNRLLQRVPREERNHILNRAETVELATGFVVCEAGRPIQQVYFPLDALISAVSTVSHHPPLEVAMIGSEGMIGSTVVLGVHSAVLDAYVRAPGTALRMSTTHFRDALDRGPGLQKTLLRYLYIQMSQMARGTLCNRFHELDARLARWLLMTHDRLQGDDFFLIHKALAELLGMRRSGVTIAAGNLQAKGYIRYARGHITILDRPGLQRLACECYRAGQHDYDRLFA